MMAPTVVFATGVSRGIGKAIVTAYLARPNHIVIGSVRDAKAPAAEELKKLPTADGTRLLLVTIENTSYMDPKKAVEEVEAAGVDHIDVVISNAGVSPGMAPLALADPKVILETLNINAVSTVTLFQAVNDLLVKSSSPKWISISSRVGSIGDAAEFYPFIGAYGSSKAAQNWFTKTLHLANPAFTVFAVHPGFVYTDMGVAAATAAGIDMPATSAEESATKLLKRIDSATRESISGKFIDNDTGDEYLW